MESHDALDPRSSLWDLVAVQLRNLRTTHGWTCQQVGDVARASRSHVSNWEAGRRRPNQANLAPLDEAWDTADLLTSLAEHAKNGQDRPRAGSFLEYERTATSIKNYTSDVVFGLLQSEGYARALFRRGGVVDDIDAAVAERLGRQERLYEAKPPKLWVILAQPVLWWQVGDSRVMRGQLEHLLEVARLEHVSLRVFPVSAGWPGVSGSLSLMATSDSEVAYLESGRMGRVVERPVEVRELSVGYDGIGARALPEDQSRTLIEHMLGLMR
ncbi:helix-turn-helix domain-containing protein [Actinomadura violacea]|uniref:Helix-turn-helix transcriptional regulator n=1 Tax=Actinomadura violacea TaxID=2819934 RepID=A0ABS3RQB2_9ACTN|nr:helix-turn-helix transcriptional regulator [Actinomadura violacea]MBO2458733.1 helix-turn-helix transcriptional regulator [Actinomadura violacea]